MHNHLKMTIRVTSDLKEMNTFKKNFGGDERDAALSGHQTKDGGYIMFGWTNSFGAAGNDMYIIKTDDEGLISSHD